jgi:hypothetical protein
MQKFAPIILGSIFLAMLGTLYLWQQPREERAGSAEAPYLITQSEPQQPPIATALESPRSRAPAASMSAVVIEKIENPGRKSR